MVLLRKLACIDATLMFGAASGPVRDKAELQKFFEMKLFA